MLHSKKIGFSSNPPKRFGRWKKLPNEFKCRKKQSKNSTELEKVLHLGTLPKPLPRNLFKFRKKLKRFCRKPTGSVFSLRNPKGYSFILRTLFRSFTKLKKVSWQRFRECAQVKNLFMFRRIFLFPFLKERVIQRLKCIKFVCLFVPSNQNLACY